MTLPVKAMPATGVLEGQDAGVLELTLGVQPPPAPPPPLPPPVETLPPQPLNAAKQRAAKEKAAKDAEIENGRRTRGSFTVEFPIHAREGSLG
jgi:hypothetical protein